MKTPVLIAGALILSTAVLAEPLNMKPGLWKHSFTMSSESGRLEAAMEEMQRQLAQMPPEQRQMMEQMMSAQGMSMQPGGGSAQVCLTEEEIERGIMPQQEGCQQEVLEQSDDRLRVRFMCDGDPPSSGEGEVVFHSPERYSGKATLNTEMDGQPEVMTIDQAGEWVSDDCGAIKPGD